MAVRKKTVSSNASSSPPQLQPSTTYTWDALGEAFQFSADYLASAGGMVSRPGMKSLLLITHSGGAKSFNYEDYWDGNELVYTGRGQIGDQQLQGQNLQLAKNSSTNFVFEYAGPRRLHFIGIARCTEYWPARGADGTGAMRRIYRYRLNFSSGTSPSTASTYRPPPAIQSDRRPRPFDETRVPSPLTMSLARASPEETLALQEKATHEHHGLLVALKKYLLGSGWTDIEEIPGAVDLWAKNPTAAFRVIFEAKTIVADTEVAQTRSALSQLLEYRHFHGAADDRLCLVTNSPISDTRERFLGTLGVGVLLCEGGSFRPAGAHASEWFG